MRLYLECGVLAYGSCGRVVRSAARAGQWPFRARNGGSAPRAPAGEWQIRRPGLRLFRTVLAADKDIVTKADSAGQLHVMIVYHSDRAAALEFASELERLSARPKDAIRKLPVLVRVVALEQFATIGSAPDGAYLVEPLPDDALRRLSQYGIEHRIITYSPFDGDVARGLLGSMIIEARVRPHLNLQVMRSSKLRIKDFFLRVAEHHDP